LELSVQATRARTAALSAEVAALDKAVTEDEEERKRIEVVDAACDEFIKQCTIVFKRAEEDRASRKALREAGEDDVSQSSDRETPSS
jgi:hypothetical protein